jgi:hypothetical protein
MRKTTGCRCTNPEYDTERLADPTSSRLAWIMSIIQCEHLCIEQSEPQSHTGNPHYTIPPRSLLSRALAQ